MLRLEPFTPADFKRLIFWLDNEELLVQVAGPIFSYPLTEEQLFNYLDDANRHAFKVVDAGAVIGHAEIYKNDDGTAKLCRILIGDKACRGKGIGKALMRELVDYSIETLKATSVELNVYDWNTQAIKCYEQVGFVFNPEKFTTIGVKGSSWKSLNMVLKHNYGTA